MDAEQSQSLMLALLALSTIGRDGKAPQFEAAQWFTSAIDPSERQRSLERMAAADEADAVALGWQLLGPIGLAMLEDEVQGGTTVDLTQYVRLRGAPLYNVVLLDLLDCWMPCVVAAHGRRDPVALRALEIAAPHRLIRMVAQAALVDLDAITTGDNDRIRPTCNPAPPEVELVCAEVAYAAERQWPRESVYRGHGTGRGLVADLIDAPGAPPLLAPVWRGDLSMN